MNNRFNDPFYTESSYVRTQEESGLKSGGGGMGGGSKVNWNALLDNAPQILAATGAIVGTVSSIKNQSGGGSKADVKAACGRKPLFNIGGKKDRYRECAERVLNPPQASLPPPPPPGMSTTKKVLIGVGIVIFLAVMTFVIIKVSRKK